MKGRLGWHIQRQYTGRGAFHADYQGGGQRWNMWNISTTRLGAERSTWTTGGRYEINLLTPFLVSVLGDSLRYAHTRLFGARHIAGTDLDLSLGE